MTETNPTPATETESNDDVVVEPNFVQKFVNKHPRAAKVVAIIGGVAAVGGTATVINTARKNKHHLDAAADHVLEAGSELSNAVSPTSETAAS